MSEQTTVHVVLKAAGYADESDIAVGVFSTESLAQDAISTAKSDIVGIDRAGTPAREHRGFYIEPLVLDQLWVDSDPHG